MIKITNVMLFETYDYRKREYVKETEYREYGMYYDHFCACCGAIAHTTENKKKQKSEAVYDCGIAVYFTDVDIPRKDDIEVSVIQTKNGVVTVANAIAWSDFDPSDEDNEW